MTIRLYTSPTKFLDLIIKSTWRYSFQHLFHSTIGIILLNEHMHYTRLMSRRTQARNDGSVMTICGRRYRWKGARLWKGIKERCYFYTPCTYAYALSWEGHCTAQGHVLKYLIHPCYWNFSHRGWQIAATYLFFRYFDQCSRRLFRQDTTKM